MGAIFIAIPILGIFLFINAVGIEGTMKLVLIIAGVIGLFALLTLIAPILAYYFFILLMGFVFFYSIDGWNTIAYIVGIPIVIIGYWLVYKIGERFHWWDKTYPY